MKSYASVAELKLRLGIPAADTNHDDACAMALVAATAWVDWRIGDLDVTPDDVWTGDAGDVVVDTTARAAAVKACLVEAVRAYKAEDVPFGIAGTSDQGMVAYVRQSNPEAERILQPLIESWGIG